MPKDFRITQDGRLHLDRLVEKADFIQQSLWIRLGLWLGSYYLNSNAFVDWGLAFQYNPPRLPELYAQVRETILGTWGVTSILEFSPMAEANKLRINFTADSVYGPITFDQLVTP